jgi:NAD(P)H dehydrogenase (quinone)
MRAASSNAPVKTVVIGANGCVGISTLEALLLRNAGRLEIFAGVRDAKKFEQQKLNIPTVMTDMSRRLELAKNLKGFQRAFVVVPCDRNRTGLASIALDACKDAGLNFVLLLSITIANTDTIFGRQFRPIEDRAKSLGINYTILRVPMFMDNIYAHVHTIKNENRICDPRNPRVQFASLSLDDLGRCAADILIDPQPHHGKTYNLVSQTFSMIDLSQSMSSILKRDVKVREVSWNTFRDALAANQIPEWQVDGLIEWLESNHDRRIHRGDLENIFEISGEKACTLNFFLAVNAPQFGWTM